MKQVLKKERWLLFLIILISLIEAITFALFSLKLGVIIDTIANEGEGFAESFIWCISLSGGFFLAGFFKALVSVNYEKRINVKLKESIYEKINSKEIWEYTAENNEYYLNILTKNIDIIEQRYISIRINMITQIFTLLAAIGTLFYINWLLTLCFLGITVVVVILAQIPGFVMAKKTEKFNNKNKEFLNVCNNHLNGFKEIKLLTIYDIFKFRFKDINNDLEKTRKACSFADRTMVLLSVLLMILSQLAALSISVTFALKGTITVGLIVSSINLLNNVFGPLQYISNDVNYIRSTKPIRQEITNVINYEKTTEKQEFNETIQTITYDNFSLTFGEKAIHTNFYTRFEANKSYAITGESGIGKSGLIRSLLNFYNPENTTGKILINGIEARDIKDEDLYRKIAYIESNDFFIKGTVKDNILLGRDLKINEELLKEFKFTNEFINKEIEFGSAELVSAGEKQRINILRFLVNNYDVLIFDEPTSNLDKETAKLVFEQILSIKNKIVICITHEKDQQTLKKFDQIIEIKGN